jgi:hypothetical protein
MQGDEPGSTVCSTTSPGAPPHTALGSAALTAGGEGPLIIREPSSVVGVAAGQEPVPLREASVNISGAGSQDPLLTPEGLPEDLNQDAVKARQTPALASPVSNQAPVRASPHPPL